MTEVQIYTDGSARGNPDGPGGYGVVMHYTDRTGKRYEKTMSGGYVRTTNNRMELMAAIAGWKPEPSLRGFPLFRFQISDRCL